MTLEYDKKIYGKRNAWPFTLFQYIFLPGFILLIVGLGIESFVRYSLPFPEWLSVFMGFYIMFSFVGFPLASIFKLGTKRMHIRSTVKLHEKQKQISYEKLAEMNWTAVGHVMEYHNYFISAISEVIESRRFYIIKGDISLTIINNGRHYKTKKVDKVKIPIAYSGMEIIPSYTTKEIEA